MLVLSPKLAEHNAGFDGLPEPDLVSKKHALREWRSQSEERCFDLMRVEIHGRVE